MLLLTRAPRLLAAFYFITHLSVAAAAQPVVPGSGTWLQQVGDDFEDTEWKFIHRHPKSSEENDEQTRHPLGRSENNRWLEGPERGQPDEMKVIPTPAGGIEGSRNALQIRTKHSGIPGTYNNNVEQDDLIVNSIKQLHSTIRPSEIPSFVARVYLPPFEQWENRSGPHFGIRAGLRTTTTTVERTSRFQSSTKKEMEPYWPGMWIHFRSETDRNVKADSAYLKIRGARNGSDFKARELEHPGWWTFGMSVTPNGQVHYYASEGVDDLTSADFLSSQFPYGFSAEHFSTFFFNSCNYNNGRTWSTAFVIDDPKLFVLYPERLQQIARRYSNSSNRSRTAGNSKNKR